jgi:hypothetical protein
MAFFSMEQMPKCGWTFRDFRLSEQKFIPCQAPCPVFNAMRIENFKVTGTFDFIYLPSDYNNGMYLYTLLLDGKAMKTEKMILNK